MMFAKDYRAQARQALQGKWKRTALLVLLALLLGAGAVNGSSGVSFSGSDLEMLADEQMSREMLYYLGIVGTVVSLVSAWVFFMGSFVRVGQMNLYNRLLDGETPRAGMFFVKGVYWKSLGLAFMKGLFIGLWSMLFVIPGIIAAYRYSMAEYIMATNPGIGVMNAISESKARMAGRKWRMFCLELSFIGWELLAALPAALAAMAAGFAAGFAMVPMTSAVVVIPLCIGGLITAIASLFVYAYINTAMAAFWKDADRGGQWREEARAGEEYAQAAYGEAAAPEEPCAATPVDESAARDLYLRHKCSHSEMEKAGVLAEYLLLRASSISEARWRREYADALMRRFDQDPSALDDLLSLAAENGAADLMDRTISRIERHLRQQSLSCVDIANMCGRVLAVLNSGALDEDAGFVSRKKDQIAALTDRLELRLQQEDPEGQWPQVLEMIRKMCK